MSFLCCNLNAQQVETKTARFGEIVNVEAPKKEAPKKENPFSRDAKIFVRIALGGDILLDKKNSEKLISFSGAAAGWNATAVVGYQLTQKFSFGAGTGCYVQFAKYRQDYYAYNDDYYPRENYVTSPSLNSLPLFLNARIHLSEGSCQPFIDVKLGYMLGLNSVITDCKRTFINEHVSHGETIGDEYWYGVYDEWYQYDTYSKMQGFYGALTLGLSFKNFDLGFEIKPTTWKQNFEKVYHKEFRQNGLPDWEYEQTLQKHNKIEYKSGGSESKSFLQFGLKIAYTMPIKKA